VIQTFNDEPVNTLREMVAAESKVKAGTTVKLSIWREGRDMKTQVTFVAPQHSVDRQRPQHTKSNTARAAQ
jgi:S1-C subfamily serine protease